MDAPSRIERRLKLHNLTVLAAVARLGSMGKAATVLNTSQPAISRSIAELEQALGVHLLERDRRGVRPTEYGYALLKCGTAVFDALREGIRSIEGLADATVGEVRLGTISPMTAHLVPAVFGDLAHQHPGISIHVSEMPTTAQQYRELRERNVDLVFGRIAQSSEDDIDAEVLFYDRIYIVAGPHSPWLRRRKIQLSDLADERWGMPPLESPIGVGVADVFRKSKMKFPPRSVITGSAQLVSSLAEIGSTLSILPGSVLHFAKKRLSIRAIKLDLQMPSWPVGIIKLKSRPLRPVVRSVIEQFRKSTAPLA